MNTKLAYVVLVLLTVVSIGSITHFRRSAVTPVADKGVEVAKKRNVAPNTAPSAQALNSAPPAHANGGTITTAPTVSDLTETLRSLSTEDLKEKLEALTKQIQEEEWVERANRGDLTAETMTQFEEMLNTETATRIVLLERDVAKAKDKYL